MSNHILKNSQLKLQEQPNNPSEVEGGAEGGGTPTLRTRRHVERRASTSDIEASGVDMEDNVKDKSPVTVIKQGILVKRSASSSTPSSIAIQKPTPRSKTRTKPHKDSIRWKEPVAVVQNQQSNFFGPKLRFPIRKRPFQPGVLTTLSKITVNDPKVAIAVAAPFTTSTVDYASPSKAKVKKSLSKSKIEKNGNANNPPKNASSIGQKIKGKGQKGPVSSLDSRSSRSSNKKRGASMPVEKKVSQKAIVEPKSAPVPVKAKPKNSNRAVLSQKKNSSITNFVQAQKAEELNSLSDFVSEAKSHAQPPKFPNLHVCNVLPGTPEWDTYWENFNNQINSYNKAMEKYSRGVSDFSEELDEYSRRLKRETLDDLAFQAQLGMRPGDKKRPILRELVSIPLTIVGPYVIKRNIKSKSVFPSPISVYLTSYDHQSFRMEIGLNATLNPNPAQVEYKELLPNETYFLKIDSKFNILSVKIVLPQKSNLDLVYKEELQIGVPPEKNVYTDLQVSPPILNKGRIVINGK